MASNSFDISLFFVGSRLGYSGGRVCSLGTNYEGHARRQIQIMAPSPSYVRSGTSMLLGMLSPVELFRVVFKSIYMGLLWDSYML